MYPSCDGQKALACRDEVFLYVNCRYRSYRSLMNPLAPGPRGRPLKFGRSSVRVSLTLPGDTVDALRALDADLGRAIVGLSDGTRPGAAAAQGPPKVVELMRTGRREALIVIDPTVLPTLPRCSYMRIGSNRAFIALEAGAGLADLELSVIDRIADAAVSREQARALRTIRAALRRWRQDRDVTVSVRSIVVLE